MVTGQIVMWDTMVDVTLPIGQLETVGAHEVIV